MIIKIILDHQKSHIGNIKITRHKHQYYITKGMIKLVPLFIPKPIYFYGVTVGEEFLLWKLLYIH